MITQLKAINAAIALGDLAVPPEGAVLEWPRKPLRTHRRGIVLGVWRGGKQHKLLIRLAALVRDNDGSFSRGSSHCFRELVPAMRVVSLPEGCPPFEEWERPT